MSISEPTFQPKYEELFQKSIRKLMLIGIDRYDDNIEKILIRNPQNQRGKNRGMTIRNSMFDSILRSLNLNSKIELLLLIF